MSGQRVFQEHRGRNAKAKGGNVLHVFEKQLGGHCGWREVNEAESGGKSWKCPGIKPCKGLATLAGTLSCVLRIVGSHWKVFRRVGL